MNPIGIFSFFRRTKEDELQDRIDQIDAFMQQVIANNCRLREENYRLELEAKDLKNKLIIQKLIANGYREELERKNK